MIDVIIARLKSTAPLLGERVEGAASLGALMTADELPAATPVAYVVALGTDAGPADMAVGVHRQTMTHRVGIVWVVTYAGSAVGAEVTADISAIANEIITALTGFQPIAGQGTMVFLRSRLVDANVGTFFCQTDFSFSQQLRITS